jgi:penicillin amidase
VSRWLILLCALCHLCVLVGCRRSTPPPPLSQAQVSGTIEVAGLASPVRIIRDRWGVPHIYAGNQDDLFFAQGFVQAQDRLFQMDLWRRSVQGRLAQVLGPNFIERDAMTRRVQFTGDAAAEWASYGADAKAIATAFVRGINERVTRARERLPEEFVLAGWAPDFWSPDDVLNRTDAFTSSGDAIEEAARRQLSTVVADALRSIGAPPFFAGLAAPVRSEVRLKPDATAGAHGEVRPNPDQELVTTPAHTAVAGSTLTISESRGRLEHPSRRYFVHLHAPGWNVIGATSPWLPGVVSGHNERIACGATAIEVDTQDVYAESADAPRIVIKETIPVKGREKPFAFDREITPHGVVFASDRARRIVYTLRWSGTHAGAAPEMAALAIDRARDWSAFRQALAAWKMPARRIVYLDVDGNRGFQDAALAPVRRSGEWVAWTALDRLPHALNPHGPIDATSAPANGAAPGPQAIFAHPLAVSAAARRRFNVGPLVRPADDNPVRAVFDARDWDRSRALNAPGQAESPASPHFADLAALWSAGESFPLAFTDAAVQANQESVLTLVPKR